ncbi:MAG: ATP-binding protein [Thermoprotei archaeon]|nr:MAG: ATP-binding protein [Thermoprotei archaeon]
MSKEYAIGQIIKEFQEKEEEIIERELKVPLDYTFRKAISIVGPRRAGKTFYLLYLYQKIRKDSPSIFFPLDDDRIYPPSLKDLDLLLKVSREILGKKPVYLFLDEIQEVDSWERFVKRAVEREGILVYITGSSSRLLSKEIASLLRGRTVVYEIFPFTFTEVLKARNLPLGKYFSSREEAAIKREAEKYLEYGGFPEVILREEKEKILREYAEVMFYRDIVERYKIRRIDTVKLFFKIVFTSFARYFSINKVANYMKSLGLRISKNSLYSYLDYMNDAYIAFPLRRFSYSLRIVEQSIPKIYVVDNGLARVYNVITPEMQGQLLENLVFMELRKRGFIENENIFYYKINDNEVDFIIVDKGEVKQLIQVTYYLRYDDREQWKREVKTLVKASKELKCKKLVIVTWSQEDKILEDNREIEVKPLWRWLIDLKLLTRSSK